MDNGTKSERGVSRKRVYDFIVKFIKENNCSPCIREICIGTGLSSTSSVYNHLVILKMMGKIDMKENSHRSIRLVNYSLEKNG